MDERLLDQELLGRDWPPATVAHGPCVRPSHGVAPTANSRLRGGATKGGGGPGPFQSWIVPTESFPVPYMKLFSGGESSRPEASTSRFHSEEYLMSNVSRLTSAYINGSRPLAGVQ
ncbi:unnamed protein product [Penicillium roqueforti FM164]|uniref:Uncharacterized protein n=1 Tax=Penicillium roqueforti (strain FM164) TaxID=1365484 RepID=W6QPK9_PENRF|nr:unnamed protein product [Penicillium roqueforti FM164]